MDQILYICLSQFAASFLLTVISWASKLITIFIPILVAFYCGLSTFLADTNVFFDGFDLLSIVLDLFLAICYFCFKLGHLHFTIWTALLGKDQ